MNMCEQEEVVDFWSPFLDFFSILIFRLSFLNYKFEFFFNISGLGCLPVMLGKVFRVLYFSRFGADLFQWLQSVAAGSCCVSISTLRLPFPIYHSLFEFSAFRCWTWLIIMSHTWLMIYLKPEMASFDLDRVSLKSSNLSE